MTKQLPSEFEFKIDYDVDVIIDVRKCGPWILTVAEILEEMLLQYQNYYSKRHKITSSRIVSHTLYKTPTPVEVLDEITFSPKMIMGVLGDVTIKTMVRK
jgi:hypothetical protein